MGLSPSDFFGLVMIFLILILGFYRVEKKLEKIEKLIDSLGGRT